jgi:putative AlgH/UPF0301 family transcriptional regulator
MTDLRAGQLLVATAQRVAPNFAETVVLLLDADETKGALYHHFAVNQALFVALL